MSVNDINMPHPDNVKDPDIVTVYVNNRPVPLDKNPITPLEIEHEAQESGVPIDPPCSLYEDGKDLPLNKPIHVRDGEKFSTSPFSPS